MSAPHDSQELEPLNIYYNPNKLSTLPLIGLSIFFTYKLFIPDIKFHNYWIFLSVLTWLIVLYSLLVNIWLKFIFKRPPLLIKVSPDKIIIKGSEIAIEEITNIRLERNPDKYGIISPTKIVFYDKNDTPRLLISHNGTGKTGKELYKIIKEYIQKLPVNSQNILFND